MLFNSFHFLLFYIVILVSFFMSPARYRWLLLLVSSYYFYMCWKPEYIIIIIFSTVLNYYCGLQIERSNTARTKRIFLCVSIVINLGILFFFKYADFFGENINVFLQHFNIFHTIPRLNILLPIGISFYTFQVMGYLFDVYSKKSPAEKHLGIFALYVAFFPQVLAGPIERSYNLLPQLKKTTGFTYQNTRQGLEWILWGMFKKVVIADLIITVVDSVYLEPRLYSGPILLFGTVCYSIQIYCDFSGYSDIAKGVAKIFGYDIMTNFRQPYLSKSIVEFWTRWHISLSSWLRDYLYIPLGGNRVPLWRWCLDILLVFLLCGLWHGAKWTFIVWGIYHGVLIILARMKTLVSKKVLQKVTLTKKYTILSNIYRPILLFLFVSLGWIFFRADSVTDAVYIIQHVFTLSGFRLSELWNLGLPRFEIASIPIIIIVLFFVDIILYRDWEIRQRLWNNSRFRTVVYCLCLYSIIFFGVFKKINFIYFQF